MSQGKIFLAVGIGLDRVKTVFASLSLAKTSPDQADFVGEGSWESYLDDNGLLSAAEASFRQASSFLSPKAGQSLRPAVIFAVPQHWVDDNSQITPEKSRLLKEVSLALGGQFLGFSSEAELLLAYFKNQENDTLVNLVAVSLGKDKLTVFPIVRGQVLGVQVVKRSEDVALDLEEGLARFNSDQPFPPRILVLGAEEDLDGIRSDLLGYSWVESGQPAFMHLPKVEIFPYQKILATLTDQAREFLSDTDTQEADQPEFSKADISQDLSLVSGEETVGALGFVKNQDVASQEGISPDHKSEPANQQEGPSKSFPSLGFKPSLILTKLELFWGKIKTFWPPRSKNINHLEPTEGKSLPIPMLIILVIVLLLGLLVGAWWYFPKAELVLSVTPKYSEDNISLLVSTSTDTVNLEEKIIPAHQVFTQMEVTDKLSTTGEDLVGDRAQGEVTIYNRTTIEKTFPEGTTLESSDGLLFLTREEVFLEAAKIDVDEDYNQVTTPSRKTVGVVAADIGADYNLSANQEFEVDDFIKDDFVAKNEAAFSGGSSRKVRVVAEEDQESLRGRLLALINSRGEEELAKQLSSEEKLISQSLEVDLKEENFSHDLGEETEELSLTVKADLAGLAYQEKDLNYLIEELLRQQTPPGFVLGAEKRVDFKFVEEQEEGALFSLNFGASLYPELDEAEIKRKIAGRKLATIKDYLSLLPSVDASEVIFSPPLPDFLLTLPHRADNITITMEAGE